MQTKFNERILITSDLDQMKKMYVAENLFRQWSEEIVDKLTGEIRTLERRELIFEKGTFLDDSNLTKINFHLQTGDIKSVKVSDIQRTGTASKINTNIFVATIESQNEDRKHNIYLYANSVTNAVEIATDFAEQKINGTFYFLAVKKLNNARLIPDDQEVETIYQRKEEENQDYFYKIIIELSLDTLDDQNPHTVRETYILRAKDAEQAKQTIERKVVSELPKHPKRKFVKSTILSAQTISCRNIIDYNFSEQYIYNENNDDDSDNNILLIENF